MADRLKIAVIVGSIRKGSINKKLASAIENLLPDHVQTMRAEIDELPLYNQDNDANQPDSVKKFKQIIESADGVLIITPEYNRSMPGVLKNAIDHGSRPYGKSSWKGKPVAILGISPGKTGTAMAQQHLRNVCAAVGMPTLAAPEAFIQNGEGFFTEDGGIGEQSLAFVQSWVDAAVAWIEKNS